MQKSFGALPVPFVLFAKKDGVEILLPTKGAQILFTMINLRKLEQGKLYRAWARVGFHALSESVEDRIFVGFCDLEPNDVVMYLGSRVAHVTGRIGTVTTFYDIQLLKGDKTYWVCVASFSEADMEQLPEDMLMAKLEIPWLGDKVKL